MSLSYKAVNFTIKGLSQLMCRVDQQHLNRVPAQGPLILVGNHINFLDAPVLYTHLQPRPITGYVKLETWQNPALGKLFDLWGAIPIRRGEADMQAIRQGLNALNQGAILAISPEGTRSGDGCLKRGHPGVVFLALQSGAPILPLVFYGNEKFRTNLSRFRRTDFRIIVGNPFYLDKRGMKLTKDIRQKMVDEIMYQISALLPYPYRGYYSNILSATEEYLYFPKSSRSNLFYAN